LLSDKTKIVTVNHISNALGTVNPIKYMTDKAHEFGAAVLIDGAFHISNRMFRIWIVILCFQDTKYVVQQELGFYGKESWLNKLPTYQGGGEMIKDVSFEKTLMLNYHISLGQNTNVAGGIVLGTAVDYMNSVGFDNIQQQELELLEYGTRRLLEIEGLKIYGTAAIKLL
jgi:cysteine desulfurase/selenocysteine lyase